MKTQASPALQPILRSLQYPSIFFSLSRPCFAGTPLEYTCPWSSEKSSAHACFSTVDHAPTRRLLLSLAQEILVVRRGLFGVRWKELDPRIDQRTRRTRKNKPDFRFTGGRETKETLLLFDIKPL